MYQYTLIVYCLNNSTTKEVTLEEKTAFIVIWSASLWEFPQLFVTSVYIQMQMKAKPVN